MTTAALDVRAGGLVAADKREKSRGRPQSSEKERINLVLSPKSIGLLDQLREKTEAASYSEVFKNALRLYAALIEESERGREFYVKDEEGSLISYRIFY